ncbi:MAG TPA: iron-containing alcohol dehydrogenase [Candidatus Limnocylindrales bacterium]|nr:iron-containing alcohol dehydrogenase [Candidatus Limnocylindrales bacterium]
MRFEFATAQKIVFGNGTIREAGPLARRFGSCALVVTGRSAARAEPLHKILDEQGIRSEVFAVAGEPDVMTVERGVAAANAAGSDLIISLGGGSAIDAGKAIAAMLANQGELLDYLEVIGAGKNLAKPSIPFIAIPTTAGTGSEVTRNAVLGSPAHRVKVSLRSPFMLPRVAIVDPELTYDLPSSVTASTGLDALTQVIEPYVSSRANALTDAICAEGMRRAARSLRKCFTDGHNTAAREDMAIASLFGGLALANAGLGAVHGFAGPIGGMFPAPHGAVCAVLLPHVMEINLRAARQRQTTGETLNRYQQVAGLLTGNSNATADQGVAWIADLVAGLNIPRLGTYGIEGQHTGELVDKASKASSMKANPIMLTVQELVEILERAI